MSQEDAKRHLDAIAGLYIEFLMERGVDLYHDEPLPVYEDYLRWCLSDGPTHLATSDAEWRTQMAFQAWFVACTDREMRIAWASGALLTAYFLAAEKAMMEICLEEKGSIPEELILTIRRDIVQRLWQEQLWYEPWCSLVNQEFPGPEPTAKDIEEFEAFRETDETAFRKWMERLDEAHAILFEYGYLPEAQENDLIFKLVATAALFTAARSSRAEPDINDRRPELEALVVERSSHSAHPAWSAVIDYLITAKSLC